MKDEFIKYLNTIGITTDALHERIEQVYKDCLDIVSEEVVDIFVEEYIKEDGSREIEGVNFFSENYQFTASQFLTKDDYVLARLKKNVLIFKIQKQNYDFKKATEKSRLNLVVTIEGNITGNFKASKENCDYLKDIIFKYFRSNLKD